MKDPNPIASFLDWYYGDCKTAQKELYLALGIKPVTVYNWFRRRPPAEAMRRRLEIYFNLPMGTLRDLQKVRQLIEETMA